MRREVQVDICTLCMLSCSVVPSCPTLCDPVACSPPGSSVHGVLQARTLEWAAVFPLQGNFPTGDWTRISCVFCITGGFSAAEPAGKPHTYTVLHKMEPEEGRGSLPQCSLLENPTDRGAWWAAGHGVAESRTRLSD